MVADESGYVAREREFRLSDVTRDAVAAMERREVPLGFARDQWRKCLRELYDALEGVDAANPDARLQGSAAYFFSRSPDPKKRFPKTRAEVEAQARDGATAEEAVESWQHAGYDREGAKPAKHFWDSRVHLKLSMARSDYDLQLSSDALAAMLVNAAKRDAIPEDRWTSPKGGHYQQELISKGTPFVALWAARWSEALKRKVNIAAFPAAGPHAPSAFTDEDWVCQLADREE